MVVGVAHNRAKPGARTAGGREAIVKAAPDIRHAGPAVETEQFDPGTARDRQATGNDHSTAAVLQQVRGDFSGDERNATNNIFGETDLTRNCCHGSPRFPDLTELTHANNDIHPKVSNARV